MPSSLSVLVTDMYAGREVERQQTMRKTTWGHGIRRLSVAWLALLLIACGGETLTPAPTPLAAPGIASVTTVSGPRSDNEKIDEVFQQLLAIYQSQGADAATQFARDQGLLTTQNDVRVTLILDNDDMNVVTGTTNEVMRLGGRVTAMAGNEMEIVVPLQTLLNYAHSMNQANFLTDLANFQHVRDIRRTPVARPRRAPTTTGGSGGGKTSEGVKVTGADVWQAGGITGKGVKVGVIDGSFNQYRQVLQSAQVATKTFRVDGLIEEASVTDDSIHGTACAEIVHEMAPDAALFLVATDTPGSFVNAVNYLVKTVGVSVITTSVGWNVYQLNGTSVVAKAVDSARAAGVFFTVAAGNEGGGKINSNEASGHFGATFTDTDGDGYHDFPGAKTKNSLLMRIGKDPVELFFSWADWEHPHVNYDLYLVDRNGKDAAHSTIDQTRTGKQPLEVIRGAIPEGTYTVKLRKVNAGDPDLPFDLFFYGAQFEQVTPAGSLDSPADAQGAVTVAAIDWQTLMPEAFSSQGPTVDGRKKPDLGAPDRVSNEAYATAKERSFPGTSAASPHAGGAAVLYRQAFPRATADEVLGYFVKNAKKPAGMRPGDNLTGAGTLYLGLVPMDASTMPAPATVAAVLPGITPAAVTRSVFTDDFTTANTGLPPAGYMSGSYRLTTSAGMTQIAAYSMNLNAPRATYEVTAQRTGGANDAEMGLVVRRQDADNYLAFAITNSSVFTVTAKVNGKTTAVVPATKSAAVLTNTANTLRVIADGTLFTFTVNGQVVSVIDIRDIWRNGTYGLVATGGTAASADLSFSKLSVTSG